MRSATRPRKQYMHAMREQALLHIRVMLETLVAVMTLVLIALGVFFFLSGSQILSSNVERMGVRLQRTVHEDETFIFGSFVVRSDCTHVDVATNTSAHVPEVYLTENESDGCVAYRNPLPYTFSVSLDSAYTGPIAVFINGDRIATVEE